MTVNSARRGEVTCKCGRKWYLDKRKLAMRDKDDVRCVCGEILAEWNGGVIWVATLVKDISK